MNKERTKEEGTNKKQTKKNDTQQRITLRPSEHDHFGSTMTRPEREREREADLVAQCVYMAQFCGQNHDVLRVASICSYFP